MGTSPSDPPTPRLTGAGARQEALLIARVILIAITAAAALAGPWDVPAGGRSAIVAACAGAALLHLGLGRLSERRPRWMRTAMDLDLIVDAALVVVIADRSGGVTSPTLWLIPALCLAVALGLSAPTGFKCLALFAVAVGIVALTGPQDVALANAAMPLAAAGAAVVIAAAMTAVNERELRRRGERMSALHAAGAAFGAANDAASLHAAAEEAARLILPGWECRVRADSIGTGMRAWRADGYVHLALPVVSRSDEDAGGRPGPHIHVHTTLVARRPTPRLGSATLRGQQLIALEALADALGAALRRVSLVERLERMSLVDPLTGLANRRSFDDAIEAELARSRRTGAPLGLVILDVDHFKRFNDTHGHQAGDRVLIAVGAALRRAARREDRPCRIGGEEFAVLLPGADEQGAADVAERIRRIIAALDVPGGPVTASFGAATAVHGMAAEELVAAADRRLYEAKAAGRNRVVAGVPTLAHPTPSSAPDEGMDGPVGPTPPVAPAAR